MMAIVSGMAGMIVFGGFIEFAYLGLRESTIRTQLGHVQIYKKGYSEYGRANPGKYLIENVEEIENLISTLPNILMKTRRLTLSGLVSTGENTLICKGIGVVADREDEMSSFETIVDGQQLSAEMTDGGVIGNELIKALGADVGDYLTILTTTIDGIINAVDFQVVGVAQTGSMEYDSVFVKLPLDIVQSVLATQSVEKIIILLNKTENLSQFISSLDDLIAEKQLDIEFKVWSELTTYYHKVVALYNGIFDVIRIIISVIILFSIVNTMTMTVFERVREIGTLRAIGTTKVGIMKIFVAEGFLLGLIGSILGIIVGILIAYSINFSGGIYIPPPPGMNRGYISLILIVPNIIISSTFLIVTVATISSLYPAYKASKLKIVEALRHI